MEHTVNISQEEMNTITKLNFINYAKQKVIYALAWEWVVLIILGAIVVGGTGIVLYNTYTEHEEKMAAIQYATDKGHELDMSFTNGAELTFNVTKGKTPSINLDGKSVSRIRVIPRYSSPERYVQPNGVIITPDSILENM
ncbi:hypothetical protein [Anaerosporobacter faecicola]|uniref:hypothetical protein n=1 Tax=Anaerosporobacter faecicola TaxID=2718714 RepID=UPI001438FBE0|nr:hypothetical protein [Anaerosporobacter faecicola]